MILLGHSSYPIRTIKLISKSVYAFNNSVIIFEICLDLQLIVEIVIIKEDFVLFESTRLVPQMGIWD